MAEIKKPKRIAPGDTIAFIAPASPPEKSRLERAIAYFEQRGFNIVVGESCFANDFYFAGPAADRADELHRFFEDTSINAIFSVRGGFGCQSLLHLLDYALIAENPKLFLGFSDVTILQAALFTKAGLPSISGALPAVDFYETINAETERWFWNLMETGKADWEGTTPDFVPDFQETAAGICLPGTISLFSKLIGTPFLPSSKDAILVLEDVEEPMHKIEGYLTHALQAGWIKQSNGTLFGDFAPPEKESYPHVPNLAQLLARLMKNSRIPWSAGLPYGHIKQRISLPFGTGVSVSFGPVTSLHSTESFFAD